MTDQPPVPLILCADDFGISAGVSRGIMELVEARRLSAISCMAFGPVLSEVAPALLNHAERVDIGLHLVLTDFKRPGAPTALAPNGRYPSMSELVKRVFLGKLPRADLASELIRQLETFMDVFTRPPDFIDGHHHIHQLPGIRDAVLNLAAERLCDNQPWVRSTAERLSLMLVRGIAPVKAAQVGLFGGAFRRRARQLGLGVNTGFSGVYDFAGDVPYARLFERFVKGAERGMLIMCHPGYADDELRGLDSLTDQREVELSYFLGDEFSRLLKTRNLCLARHPE